MKHKPLPNVSITEVWEHYGGQVVGRDSSEWRKAKCPIHNDENASASINEDAGKWSCWTCDLHGDVFDLIGRMAPGEQLGFGECVAIAEKFAGGSNGTIREERRGSSLLPGGSRGERGNGAFVPPWRRL